MGNRNSEQHILDSTSLRSCSLSDSHSQHSEFLDATNEILDDAVEEDSKMGDVVIALPKADIIIQKSTKQKTQKDLAFEEYLIKYKEEHKQTYIAPFLSRRLRKEFDFAN